MTGLIYAAIFVAWAAYLVPLALRRHDEAVRARSVDRFSAAMRVLARRPTGPATAPADQPPAAERGTAAMLKPRAATGSTAMPVPSSRRTSEHAARAAAAKRRRVLYALLALTAAAGGVVAAGFLPWWSISVPVLLVVAFLALCRRQVRRADESYWTDAKAAEGEPGRRAIRVEASYGEHSGGNPDEEPTVVLRRQEPEPEAGVEPEREPLADPQHVVAVSVPMADGQSLWDPLPMTLPTYVSKPKAPRVVRTIALGEPGTATAGGSEAPEAPAPAAQPAPVESGLEEEPRRAVGS